jgi:hypothetical protein
MEPNKPDMSYAWMCVAITLGMVFVSGAGLALELTGVGPGGINMAVGVGVLVPLMAALTVVIWRDSARSL